MALEAETRGTVNIIKGDIKEQAVPEPQRSEEGLRGVEERQDAVIRVERVHIGRLL